MLPTPWDNPFPKFSAIFQFARHVKCKSLALPSHHTLHKQPLYTLGGVAAWEKLESPMAVAIIPCAESHGRHAQDLHSMLQRDLRDLKLRKPHKYIEFHTAEVCLEGSMHVNLLCISMQIILSNPGYNI